MAPWLVRSTPERALGVHPWPGTLCSVLGEDTLLALLVPPEPLDYGAW